MMKRFELFDCPMDGLTMDETIKRIESRVKIQKFTQHVVVNVAKIVNMQKDSLLSESIHACDIINIDGMGVVWGARFLGHPVPERVAGVDLFDRLLAMAAAEGFSVYLLGGTAEIVEKTAANVVCRHPLLKIAGYHHGYFWDDEETLVERISQSGARLLFVAITSPKKEIFINKWKDKLNIDFVMGVGGTFDVVAGKVRRAPLWMQRCGLEWCFRVIQEPRRMWRRYFVTNLTFTGMLLKYWFIKAIRKR
jgi:N-acetylglucosaminyldiphosphoundecaprenol N-acetyl-beta-D-mannosaminyltransferase